MASRLAKILFRVVGLNVIVTSRYTDGGGYVVVDPERKALFWGETENE
jgi:hypothetical protein